jgi:hypothetical protein
MDATTDEDKIKLSHYRRLLLLDNPKIAVIKRGLFSSGARCGSSVRLRDFT